MNGLDRITDNPEMTGGPACVRDTRVAASALVNMAASGATDEEIISEFPSIEPEDIRQALRYAALRSRPRIPDGGALLISDIKEKARTVIDSSGKKRAILIDYEIWSELMEDLECMEAIDLVRESGEEYIPWEQAVAALRAQGINVSENPQPSESKPTRPFGLCAGEFVVPDDFDDPLPDHVIEYFEASDDRIG